MFWRAKGRRVEGAEAEGALEGVREYSRKTDKTPGRRLSSAAELIQSALMSKMIARRGRMCSSGVKERRP